MENPNQRWINLSYIAVSALLYFILFSSLTYVAGVMDLEARLKGLDLYLRLGSIFVALVFFVVLYRHQKANVFMNEVVSELAQVTWPIPNETMKATWVVLVMVLISGLILGFLDFFWTKVAQWVL
jgi:preprotein translocase SecE subunit